MSNTYDVRMKRISISLPDRMAAALKREAVRRRVPVSHVVREAVEAKLPFTAPRRSLPFASLGRSGHTSTSEDIDEILSVEWSRERSRQ